MPATRQSWNNLQPLPAKRAALTPRREYSEPELEQMRLGFIPERMEDKWFLFMEGNTLYVHRSWTGNCIYQMELAKEGAGYVPRTVFVNREESQYAGSDDLYDEKLLLYLVDYLLLGKRSPLPGGMKVPADLFLELHHHHVIGAGQKTGSPTIHVSLGGALKWLWRWLLWLAGR